MFTYFIILSSNLSNFRFRICQNSKVFVIVMTFLHEISVVNFILPTPNPQPFPPD
ncbi:hypothetical protein ASPBRDRAFT_349137 [Aspergillus brasiliensis CBS 101740]|uniref:Uncharacterized protein n=1 Tax=Aspergillus brasiliensis (strain CBS 101740 / IMI 381727 / IBT 21946) TaxID=767769 RepID=A0A1L9U622_ASPBC|nr:hypothetical protein ASPBRDRAFT_349137 [Aspergillus brasiliensis CBS 101740]